MTDEEIKALQDENATLKKQLEETQKIVSDMQAKAAEDSVEAACAEGKISPDMKASWKETLLKNPDAKKLLADVRRIVAEEKAKTGFVLKQPGIE